MNIRRGLSRLILLIAIASIVPGFYLGFDYWRIKNRKCFYTYVLTVPVKKKYVGQDRRIQIEWKGLYPKYFDLQSDNKKIGPVYVDPFGRTVLKAVWKVKPKGQPLGKCITFPEPIAISQKYMTNQLPSDKILISYENPPVVRSLGVGAIVALAFALITFFGLHGLLRTFLWIGKGFKG